MEKPTFPPPRIVRESPLFGPAIFNSPTALIQWQAEPLWRRALSRTAADRDLAQARIDALIALEPEAQGEAGRPPRPPSRIALEHMILGVRQFDSAADYKHWQSEPFWRRLLRCTALDKAAKTKP